MTQSVRPVVCVVDDDPSIRESLRFLLEEAGYEVEEATDVAAAPTRDTASSCSTA